VSLVRATSYQKLFHADAKLTGVPQRILVLRRRLQVQRLRVQIGRGGFTSSHHVLRFAGRPSHAANNVVTRPALTHGEVARMELLVER